MLQFNNKSNDQANSSMFGAKQQNKAEKNGIRNENYGEKCKQN